ncbi:MAG: hypothetical protein ACOYXN_11355 [Acidobacteriota bacterium]
MDGQPLRSDWEITINQDLTLHPEPGVAFRLLNLNASHLTGTGTWGHALMYGCKEGRLRRVFETVGHLYGIRLAKLDEKTFTIQYNVYLPNDPTCCASWEGTDTYTWFPQEREFKRTRSIKGPRKSN